MKHIVLTMTLSAFCSFAHGELHWENEQLNFYPAATDTEVKAEFKFTNTGPDPVTIQSVIPGCGCTTIELKKKTYKPGEEGHVTAVFKIGQRTGVQNKLIHVKIQGLGSPKTLGMTTYLPEYMKVSPRFVYWQVGEALESKSITLTVLPDARLKLTNVSSSDPRMSVTLNRSEEGGDYVVVVTPQQTANPVMVMITIATVVSPNIDKVFTAYAQVKANAAESK